MRLNRFAQAGWPPLGDSGVADDGDAPAADADVGGGVIAAAQGVVNTAKAVGETKNGRMQALGVATLALQSKDLAEQA